MTTAQSPAVPAQRVLYNITVGNVSDSAVEAVSVLMRVPDGAQFVYTTDADPNASGCGSVCTGGTEGSWNLGTIPAGQTRTITVNPSVLTTVGNGDSLTSVIRLSATGVNPVLVTKTVPVVDALPVTAALGANLDPAEPGQLVELTVDVGAIGENSLGAGELTLELPGALSVVDISDGGTQTAEGAVMWSIDPLAVHSSRHRTVLGQVSDAVVAGEVLNPRVTFVSDGSTSPALIAQLPISVVLANPLSFSVAEARNPVVPEQSSLFSITVGNTAEVAIDDVQVMMRVPRGLQVVYTTDSLPDVTGCGSVCTWATEGAWALGTIPAGETRTIDVNPAVLTELEDGDLVQARFQLYASGVNQRSIALTLPVHVAPSTRLTLTSKAPPALPGDTVELVCNVGQIGDRPTAGAVLSVELPEGLSVVSAGGGAQTNRVVSWELGDLEVGETVRRALQVAVDGTVAPGSVLDARARLVHEGGLDRDGWATLPVAVLAERPPVGLAVSTNPSPLLPGERVTYQATLTNNALVPVEDVSLVLRVPSELSFVYTTNADPNASGCGSTCAGNSESHWSVGTLAAGASKSVTVEPSVVETLAREGSLVAAHFSVMAADMNPYRLSTTQPVDVAPEVELALTASTDPVVPGTSFSYHAYVGQVGGAALTGTELTMQLPDGVVVESISDGGMVASDGSIVWDLGTVPVAASVHRSVGVELAASIGAASVLQARAELRCQGGMELDARAEHDVALTASALPLEVTFETSPESIEADSSVLLTTTITNTSARSVEGVELLLRVPDGLSFVYTTDADPDASGCGSTCVGGTEGLWSFGALAPGESKIVTVNASTSASLIAGDLVTVRQRLFAGEMAAGVRLQRVLPVAP